MKDRLINVIREELDDLIEKGITEEELSEVDLFREHFDATQEYSPGVSRRARIHETVRGMINEVVTDLVDTTRASLEEAHPADIEAVRARRQPLVGFSKATAARHRALMKFLRSSLYQHERVLEMTGRARKMVAGLFEFYMNDIHAMPRDHANRATEWEMRWGEAGRARAVADYVAGMTDRYAYSAYQRLVESRLGQSG